MRITGKRQKARKNEKTRYLIGSELILMKVSALLMNDKDQMLPSMFLACEGESEHADSQGVTMLNTCDKFMGTSLRIKGMFTLKDLAFEIDVASVNWIRTEIYFRRVNQWNEGLFNN